MPAPARVLTSPLLAPAWPCVVAAAAAASTRSERRRVACGAELERLQRTARVRAEQLSVQPLRVGRRGIRGTQASGMRACAPRNLLFGIERGTDLTPIFVLSLVDVTMKTTPSIRSSPPTPPPVLAPARSPPRAAIPMKTRRAGAQAAAGTIPAPFAPHRSTTGEPAYPLPHCLRRRTGCQVRCRASATPKETGRR